MGLWRIEDTIDDIIATDNRLAGVIDKIEHFHSESRRKEVLAVYGLLFAMNEIIGVFDPRTLDFEIKAEIEMLGTLIAVYPYKNDYILYGELEIYRVSESMEILWDFSGRDIFVKCYGDQPTFQMKEDRICLYDFEDNYYEISYDGKIIADIPAK